MRTSIEEQILFLGTSLLSTTFTANTTNVVTTGAAHGYRIGDKVRLSSATTLPAGFSANTDYYVVEIPSTTTVKLSATPSGPAIATTDAGTGTHTITLKSKVILVQDFLDIALSWYTANNANFTVKVQGSNQDNVDFESAVSATNRWSYLQVVDREDGATIDGNTGITQAVPGTDCGYELTVNVDGIKWLCLDVTSFTAGTLDARVFLSNS